MFNFFFVAENREKSPVNVIERINERKHKAGVICVQSGNELTARAMASKDHVVFAFFKKIPTTVL